MSKHYAGERVDNRFKVEVAVKQQDLESAGLKKSGRDLTRHGDSANAELFALMQYLAALDVT